MDLDRIAFSPGGLRALISSVLQVKQTADGASSAVAGLGEDVAEMARLTAAELAAVAVSAFLLWKKRGQYHYC